ncbi:cytochrome P450 315a1, mitochondrial-like isoform X1 [Venturia canescens]|uniref:cytochrome P450 315a1, mitochondrial-like isoform X1 n=1 Tax=Venturia canescens TaxID=32260 RepID=UPI001C9CAB39|nr:cytochrome P450 315a1, mitochondrial-like isoform X1 [Venturia canescens]XP_043272230.1 cytochrome P450 315a1, mitochondrial-like isoform X1 [Venturia canescens]XP_043272231.1 cytochrome P450 315a1, mitochondrial-like isoform X1 [Venturia canescens]
MRIQGVRKFGIFVIKSTPNSSTRSFSGLVPVDGNGWSKYAKLQWKMRLNFQRCESRANIFSNTKIPESTIPLARKNKWIPGSFETFVSLFRTEQAINLHEYVDKNHKELGPIFRDRIGPVDLIFVNSPDDFRKIFRLEGSTPMHFLPEAWHFYNKSRNCSRGLLFMDGEEWLHFRRIMNKVMLIPNPVNTMAPRCYEAAQDLVEQWSNFADTSKPIEGLETRLYRWSIEVMLAILIGSSWKNYKPRIDKETIKLARILHRIFVLSAKLSLLPVKYVIKFRLPVWREFCQVVDEALGSVRDIVTEILCLEGDGLLSLMIKEGITKQEDLVRIVTDLVIAAGDTTAYSTQWALLTLAKNPRVQDKLFERVKYLEPKDIMSDYYIKAIIKESLRLYPTAPFLARFLPNDAIIAGHHVSKGELMVMSIYSSGKEPKNFPDPHEFRPERWMRNEAGNYKEVNNPHGTLPFALGARSCVGKKLAETQMILTLSQIVKTFKIECSNEDAIRMILHLIAVPSKSIKLKLYKR